MEGAPRSSGLEVPCAELLPLPAGGDRVPRGQELGQALGSSRERAEGCFWGPSPPAA